MATFQSVNSKKNCNLIHNSQTQPIDLEKEVQLMTDEHAVERLVNSNLIFDIEMYTAIERQDWQEVNRIYQKIFRPHRESFAKETLLKLLNKLAA